MFVNLETSDFREAMNGSCADQWPGIAAAILRRNDREVAIGKIADQLTNPGIHGRPQFAKHSIDDGWTV